jgi:hypothetical protein
MTTRKKQFANYQEYLKSDKWAKVKADFYNWYHENICDEKQCEVSMIGDADQYDLHHWQYPKDWNDDSFENLVLVSHKTHEIIHKYHNIENIEIKYKNRFEAICHYKDIYYDLSISDINNKFMEESLKYRHDIGMSKEFGKLMKVFSELVYDNEVKLTAELDISYPNEAKPTTMYINGIRMPDEFNFHFLGMMSFRDCARKKWGEDYNVNFDYKV